MSLDPRSDVGQAPPWHQALACRHRAVEDVVRRIEGADGASYLPVLFAEFLMRLLDPAILRGKSGAWTPLQLELVACLTQRLERLRADFGQVADEVGVGLVGDGLRAAVRALTARAREHLRVEREILIDLFTAEAGAAGSNLSGRES